MVEIELDPKKTLEQNAAEYFERSKKAKSKIESIKQTIERFRNKLNQVEKEQVKIQEEKSKEKRTLKWYEKFRWFITSEGFLAVGGRDAGSNEEVIKKHMDKNDLIFHTDAAGSPFFILKTENKKPTERSIQEVADAVYIFSKSFKAGVGGVNSFYVSPNQISTTPPTGEYLERGSFIINGKKNQVVPRFSLSIGITKDQSIMCGPTNAVKKNCEKYLELVQSRNEKPSDLAKKIKKKINGDIDSIIKALPSGNVGIK
jgi:predicted ribosome quality control (RQC) complex YloA/Tae2 family protein